MNKVMTFALALFLFSNQSLRAQCWAESCEAAWCPVTNAYFDTTTFTTIGHLPSSVPNFCGSIENDFWFVVYPSEMTTTFTAQPINCQNGNGLQIALYKECNGPFIQCNTGCSGCGAEPVSITATNLEPGEPYFLLIDGWAGDQCDAALTAYPLLSDGSLDTFAIIEGRVLSDDNKNCLAEPADLPLANKIVRLNTPNPRYRNTKPDGSYRFYAYQPGDYSLTVQPSNPLYELCEPTKTVTIVSNNTLATADFLMKRLVDCVYMTADFVQPTNVRPCSTYTVKARICNEGTIAATPAGATLQIDSLFEIVSVSILPALQTGNFLTFSFDTIEPGGCRDILVGVKVVCTAPVLSWVCNELRAFPDTLCSKVPTARIEATATCSGNAFIHFTLKNTGNAPTSQPLFWQTIGDYQNLQQGQFSLNPGEEWTAEQPILPDFQYFRIEADQEPTFPFSSKTGAWAENCGLQGANFWIWPSYAANDDFPFRRIACSQVRNSFDPNEKTVLPRGIGDDHFIAREQELEYTLQFQNTGSDTAFYVELRDTLSEFLEPMSLRIGQASHPFEWEIDGLAALKFRFENIDLPATAVNEPASHGFVRFYISPRAGVPVGAKIENTAFIYFDTNLPVVTNTVMNKIGENFILVPVNESSSGQAVSLAIAPNPFAEITQIEWKNAPAGEKTIHLFDLTGRRLYTEFFDGTTHEFHRNGLASGLYFIRISDVAGNSVIGKLLIGAAR